jgi:hypothetical protein
MLLGALVLAISAAGAARAAEPDPREAEVRRMIDRYFLTWSNQDLDRYGQCFLPQAAIQLLEPSGTVVTMRLEPFLRSQRDAHRQAVNRLTETAETVEIRFEGRIARVVVYWKLVGGEQPEYGYDHFTLVNADGRWRIANLLFYADPKGPAKDGAAPAEPPAPGATSP